MKGNVEVVNVIEVVTGVVNTPRSFVIMDEKKRTEIVKKAEAFFIAKAKENGLEDEDVEEALDNGNFEDGSGYEVIISWSEVVYE